MSKGESAQLYHSLSIAEDSACEANEVRYGDRNREVGMGILPLRGRGKTF